MKLCYLLLGGLLGLSGVAAAAYFSKKSFEDDHWNEILGDEISVEDAVASNDPFKLEKVLSNYVMQGPSQIMEIQDLIQTAYDNDYIRMVFDENSFAEQARDLLACAKLKISRPMLVADIKDRRSAIMAQAKKYAPAFIAANKLLKENGLKPFDLSTLTLKDFNLPEDNSTDNDDWSSMCADSICALTDYISLVSDAADEIAGKLSSLCDKDETKCVGCEA